jgi:deleted-in-malignant-brain-tumors protein 1
MLLQRWLYCNFYYHSMHEWLALFGSTNNHIINSVAASFSTQGFAQGTGEIWLDDVRCVGTERRLIDCPSRPLGQHNCVHTDDIGVHCTGTTCPQGDIRLQEGATAFEGRVEICINHFWRTLCDNTWDNIDASVACVQLGLPSTG